MKLSEETKRHIKQAKKEIREGKTVPLAEVKKKLGIKELESYFKKEKIYTKDKKTTIL